MKDDGDAADRNASDSGESSWASAENVPSDARSASTRPGRPTSPRDGGASPAEGAADQTEDVFYCDLCGNVMLNLHCKLICERCGYKRDCSDP